MSHLARRSACQYNSRVLEGAGRLAVDRSPVADEETLRALEWATVVEACGRRTVTPMGRGQVERLMPLGDAHVVARLLRLTTEARAVLESGGELGTVPLGVPDVRRPVARAGAGGVLSGEELAGVADALEGIERLRQYLPKVTGPSTIAPSLRPWLDRLGDFGELAPAIRRAVAPDGSVLDSASPELASIRTRLRRAIERVRDALENMVRSPLAQTALQEPIITHRNGRYVVPVRQECRDMVPGIVHDASSSGATLFVEPMSVVQANNAVRTEQAREEEEIARILRELSARVGQVSAGLADALEAVGELDAIFARARLSLDHRATEPLLNIEGRVVLRGARHPLLAGRVVPIDVEVGRSFTVLVITGPNTGGKTVSLKTMGLLVLMAQAGLHVPAEPGSEVAVFARVRADIGDRQSVTDNLSTFSSHMRRIVPVLEEADEGTLVLLDELGAGTDPEEGAALGCAILDHLRRSGARVVVTTHLGDLKVMAHSTEGVANASVSFDVETLAPTYVLTIGTPGQSQALAIARRLGLPEAIAEDARDRLGPGRLRADALVEDLQRALDAARHRLEEASAAREDARRYLERTRRELERLQARRQEVVQRATEEVEGLARRARLELEALVQQARAAAKERRFDEVRRLRQELSERRRRLDDQTARLVEGTQMPQEAGPEASDLVTEPPPELAPELLEAIGDPSRVRPGSRVWVRALHRPGIVVGTAGPDGQVTVQFGTIRTRVAVSGLALLPPATDPGGDAEARRQGTARGALAEGTTQVGLQKAATISPEIDLRGQTVEEAEAGLARYLDDCVLAGLPKVRVIHGKGTGALREGLRTYLRGERRVQRFYAAGPSEGGDGVTVVELA